MNLYDSLGALTNAFTSYNVTTYLFKTSKNLEKCVNLLLDFVQLAEFPEEKVENEKKIISQEYHLGNDNPLRRLYKLGLKNTCVNYPLRTEIIGTLEDINSTTRELLYLAHRTFYHPKNMTLVIAGGFDPNKLIKLIRKNQSSKTFEDKVIPQLEINEPIAVSKERDEIVVGLPYQKVCAGYKFEVPALNSKVEEYKYNIVTDMLLEMLFGRSSTLTEKLLKDRTVLNPVMVSSEVNKFINAWFLFGDTLDENNLINTFDNILKNVNEYMSEEAFKRIKKAMVATAISALDDVETYAERTILSYSQWELNELDCINILKEIEYKDLEEAASRLYKFARSVNVLK
jgi:predicted Zn-dependent peptidase